MPQKLYLYHIFFKITEMKNLKSIYKPLFFFSEVHYGANFVQVADFD